MSPKIQSKLKHVTVDDALNTDVLAILEKATGLGSKEAWANIWLLISKAEQDNTDPKGTFEIEGTKGSLFGYASALSYDQHDRGVTIGLVGWTTANDGKDGAGDAPELFKMYRGLGGDDLMPFVAGCCKSKEKCEKLIKKIHEIAGDPRWIASQWNQLVTDSDDGAYIYHAAAAWKKVGVAKPSALALASVIDTSLNQGNEGKFGGCSNLIKLAVHGNEKKTLEAYLEWKAKVAGTNEFNDPPCNGKARAGQFQLLLKDECFSLTGCEKEIQKAISWKMK